MFDLTGKVENLLNKIDYPRRKGSDHSDRVIGTQNYYWCGSVVACLN